MRLRDALLVAGLSSVCGPALAQPLDLSLNASAVFYGDNTEFFNPFRVGETTLGSSGSVWVEARPNGRVALRAGAFGNWHFGGDRAFDQARPLLALVIGGERSRLILGTLETVRRSDGPGPDRTGPHGLLPAVQVETLAFDRPWEAGLQWLVNTGAVTHDAWINWQRLATSSRREVFDTGLSSRLRLTGAARLRGDVHLVHRGGQLSGDGPVADSLTAALGIEVGGPAGRLDRVSLEVAGLGSRLVPDRERLASARSGVGSFLRVAADYSRWRAHGILWRGDDFIAREGDPNYQSVRLDGTTYRGLRDYAEAGLTRTFDLAPSSWLEASFRLHRVESHAEYSFRIVAVMKLRVD